MADEEPKHEWVGGLGSYTVYACCTAGKPCLDAGKSDDGYDLWKCPDCGKIIKGAS